MRSQKPEEIAGLDIRYSYLTDAPALREWLFDPQVQRWFPVAEEREIEDAIQCWIGFSRYSSSLTATLDKGATICGIATLFLMPYRKVSHHCLFKMVVDPKHRASGNRHISSQESQTSSEKLFSLRDDAYRSLR